MHLCDEELSLCFVWLKTAKSVEHCLEVAYVTTTDSETPFGMKTKQLM